MEFHEQASNYLTQELPDNQTFLLTNGLGGYCSVAASGMVTRCDQGMLVAAERAPNLRITLVHRLRETLSVGDSTCFLSSQNFADGKPAEKSAFAFFTYDGLATWQGRVAGVQIQKTCAMAYGKNETAVCYDIYNESSDTCVLKVEPMLKLAPKEDALQQSFPMQMEDGFVTGNGQKLFVRTDGKIETCAPRWERLSYPEDAKDGRPAEGMAGSCFCIPFSVPAGAERHVSIVFSDRKSFEYAQNIVLSQDRRNLQLVDGCGFRDETARQLALAADAFISRRDSTDGKTILAGYPLFSDWGRDTMIALRGCCLSTKRYEDAKSILRTFAKYEKDGLMPNLFPEGDCDPIYNTVDAALLFIDSLWQYYIRTKDLDFVAETWPVLNHIVDFYKKGTAHGIKMDTDGLITAGEGFDQVTWMDVRIGDILPTPRHGKPVEVNAYWYNGLKIMESFAKLLGKDEKPFAILAEKVKSSFISQFYLEDKGYLRDVLSGTKADEQIRCNQIWAVSVAFSMLNHQQQLSVVETVQKHLFTDHGLRSLSPEDPEYHSYYGGDQLSRDLAYHQGTVWVFPLGAFYLSYLKVHGYREAAAKQVRCWLSAMGDMLKEGCAGQLPEIYDGDNPKEGKGCFAQAWSVGEMLTVYEALENLERGI